MKKVSETATDPQRDLIKQWPEMFAFLQACQTTAPVSGDSRLKNQFMNVVRKGISERGADYVGVIQSLSPEYSQTGTLWLQGIVDQITDRLILTAEPGK
jgi:hypothetical protein